MAIPGFANPTNGPAGDSMFSLIISSNGAASLTGLMADGTAGAQTSQISFYGYCPVYIPLYNNGSNGSLVGWIDITSASSNSASADSSLTWFNDAGATSFMPAALRIRRRLWFHSTTRLSATCWVLLTAPSFSVEGTWRLQLPTS